ncbi:MAG: tRNA (N6-threonylcarbamoyladenosine(37)-N6)-methyltransferase TrmO [Bacteroidales bacterium]|nr:tRNA (N6-threonylcarbamoyladenosine(37)-N6)-methyltransferase TrmO [Bacteroidales bacterium]
MIISPIAHIRTDFREKFGIPRQSGLAPGCNGSIVFEPQFRNPDCIRGLEGFSHIWLLWGFSEANSDSMTVRPPRLGGNSRVGVFASRSPFRPNRIGMSAVKLCRIEHNAENGPVLKVSGVDLLDGTPIYDIKPYIPYADCIPEATSGYTADTAGHRLNLSIPSEIETKISPDLLKTIKELIELDPRVSYTADESKIWGLSYAGYNVRFRVSGLQAELVEISAE